MAFDPEEEQRAAEWRRSVARRRAAAHARALALAGDPDARRQLSDDWAPLALALDEMEAAPMAEYVSPGAVRGVVN